MLTRSRSMRRCFATRDLRRQPCIPCRTRPSKCWSRRNRLEEKEEDSKKNARQGQEELEQKKFQREQRGSAAQASDRCVEGRRRARALYGRAGAIPGEQTRHFCSRPPAHRLATAGAFAPRAVGHS